MIFVDSNIPMYLVGAEHALKPRARRLIEDAVAAGETLCTDAEVLQEILHRYQALHRLDMIDPAFTAVLGIVDVVFPIELPDVQRARRLLGSDGELSARDALHVAVMQGRDIERVLSFDSGFDGIPGIRRVA
ncbi:MAG: type II toxin-antitoxin system VapC family toxin [Candidatus Limnocylindrales bacterium]